LAHQLAVESPHVTADVIEVSEFPELLERYHVRGVPKTIINERVTFEGALPEAAVLNRVVEAAAAGTGL
jgi:predicted DsbA family dithiol-disulfide isomerase